jgi:hypothetical protein
MACQSNVTLERSLRPAPSAGDGHFDHVRATMVKPTNDAGLSKSSSQAAHEAMFVEQDAIFSFHGTEKCLLQLCSIIFTSCLGDWKKLQVNRLNKSNGS